MAQSIGCTTDNWYEVRRFRRYDSITSACRKSYESFASTTMPDGQLLAKPDRFCLGNKQSPLTFSHVRLCIRRNTPPLAMKIALAPACTSPGAHASQRRFDPHFVNKAK